MFGSTETPLYIGFTIHAVEKFNKNMPLCLLVNLNLCMFTKSGDIKLHLHIYFHIYCYSETPK